jgi:hypothetical protein
VRGELAWQARRKPSQTRRTDRYGTRRLERDDRIRAQPLNLGRNHDRRHHLIVAARPVVPRKKLAYARRQARMDYDTVAHEYDRRYDLNRLDPHCRVPDWYVYEFFPETLTRDVERFPSASQRTAWLVAAGFTRIEVKLVERIQSTHTLEEARASGILSASFTSQLTELSENQYSDGIQRMEAAAASTGASFRLRVDLVLYATEARRPRERP